MHLKSLGTFTSIPSMLHTLTHEQEVSYLWKNKPPTSTTWKSNPPLPVPGAVCSPVYIQSLMYACLKYYTRIKKSFTFCSPQGNFTDWELTCESNRKDMTNIW